MKTMEELRSELTRLENFQHELENWKCHHEGLSQELLAEVGITTYLDDKGQLEYSDSTGMIYHRSGDIEEALKEAQHKLDNEERELEAGEGDVAELEGFIEFEKSYIECLEAILEQAKEDEDILKFYARYELPTLIGEVEKAILED